MSCFQFNSAAQNRTQKAGYNFMISDTNMKKICNKFEESTQNLVSNKIFEIFNQNKVHLTSY